MKHLPLLVCTATCGFYSAQAATTDKKDEKPNILWLTFEDTSAYEFGCYGNKLKFFTQIGDGRANFYGRIEGILSHFRAVRHDARHCAPVLWNGAFLPSGANH